jgi:HK97 gp10 family phage protein
MQPPEARLMIDFEAMALAIFERAVTALGAGANIVETQAKHMAPVRHIFAGDRYTIRAKKASEIEADRTIRAQLGLSIEGSLDNPRPKTVRTKSSLRYSDPTNRWAGTYGKRPAPQWRERRLAAAAQHLSDYTAEMAARKGGEMPQMTVLDKRGAYEVKRALAGGGGRSARSLRWGHAYVGGNLRNSIHALPATTSGGVAEVWVLAGGEEAPYAKYMEFGTRHAAAHPFLRPALAESKAEIVGRIAAAIKEASRTGGSSMDINIEVRL